MASLLLAPAGYGKTRYAIQRIRAVLMEAPFAPVIVILPNQVRVAEFRRRLAAAGGSLGVELFTFHALYAEILAQAGQSKPRLPDPVQIRLLRSIVDQLCREVNLRHYESLRRSPGFIAAMRDTIQELKRARVDPEEFSKAVTGLEPRLGEIAAIYDAYQEWLLQEDWVDPEGQGWLAAIALEQDAQLKSATRLLVVNGFDEFNPTQLEVLGSLAQRAVETLITLTGDPQRPRFAHRRFLRARQMLEKKISARIQALGTNRAAPISPGLETLESQLFERARTPASLSQTPGAGVEFVEAQNRSEEARAALRWVKARLVRDGLELSETAVLARNLEPYRPFLEEIAAEFGLPVQLPEGLALIENPAVAALLSLLSLPGLDWPRRQILEAWRSPYFDWSQAGIAEDDAARLDIISRQGRVVAGLAQWQEAFDLLARQRAGELEITADEEALPLPTVDAASLKAKFEAFTAHLTPSSPAPVRVHVVFIEDLIGDTSESNALTEGTKDTLTGMSPEHGSFAATSSNSTALPNKLAVDDHSLAVVARACENPLTGERDIAALRAFKDVLRGLALAESTLGGGPIEFSQFIDELRGAVESATYHVALEDGVLVTSVSQARGLSFRAVALLGLSEGEFPQPEREDAFLRENDRRKLDEMGIHLEEKLRGDEVTFFYQAVTRARQRLLLSRPYLAEDGQIWEPSPYWLQAWQILGKPERLRVRPEDPLLPGEAASYPEFIQASGQLDAHMKRGASVLQARLAKRAAGPYEGELEEMSARLVAHYPAAQAWSASRLEAYGTCPFLFFSAYALELEPRTPAEEGYDVRILGSMLHKILEETYRQAGNPTSLEECLELLPEVAAQVFASAPREYGFRPSALWDMQQQELLGILHETLIALDEASRGFTPRYFEERFGMGKPSLVLDTEIGEVRLHGYIDRVDQGTDGRLRVVDYKAGGSPISPQNLRDGRRLQLPIYALAASQALGLGEVCGGFYWHIGRAESSSLKLENYEGGIEEAYRTAIRHIGAHVGNIRRGKFQPEPPSDGCPRYCPASAFCWRYKPKAF
jgi:ATP-dependent helicase/DNAse subunit B